MKRIARLQQVKNVKKRMIVGIDGKFRVVQDIVKDICTNQAFIFFRVPKRKTVNGIRSNILDVQRFNLDQFIRRQRQTDK